MTETSNDIPIEAWDTVLFDKWMRFRDVVTMGLKPHGDEALKRYPFPAGARVLDVGCGFGDTTRQIAAQVGAKGEALGVDCSKNFIDLANKEDGGVANASYFVADVQSENLRGPYDHAFARFGTMFFNLPGAGFRNIRKSLKPGGRFTQIVWRKREENPWLYEAERTVREIVPVVKHEDTDQVHCGPGPFSLAGPDMVSDMLQAAGFARVTFERFDTDIVIGRDVEEAIEFAIALGPAGEIIRLAGAEGERLRPKVVSALKQVLKPRADGAVAAGSSVWIVSAFVPN